MLRVDRPGAFSLAEPFTPAADCVRASRLAPSADCARASDLEPVTTFAPIFEPRADNGPEAPFGAESGCDPASAAFDDFGNGVLVRVEVVFDIAGLDFDAGTTGFKDVTDDFAESDRLLLGDDDADLDRSGRVGGESWGPPGTALATFDEGVLRLGTGALFKTAALFETEASCDAFGLDLTEAPAGDFFSSEVSSFSPAGFLEDRSLTDRSLAVSALPTDAWTAVLLPDGRLTAGCVVLRRAGRTGGGEVVPPAAVASGGRSPGVVLFRVTI